MIRSLVGWFILLFTLNLLKWSRLGWLVWWLLRRPNSMSLVTSATDLIIIVVIIIIIKINLKKNNNNNNNNNNIERISRASFHVEHAQLR